MVDFMSFRTLPTILRLTSQAQTSHRSIAEFRMYVKYFTLDPQFFGIH